MGGIRILSNQTRTLILLALLAALVGALSFMPLAPLYFVSFGVFLLPFASITLSAVGGVLALLASAALMAWGAMRVFGPPGLMILVYVLPVGAALLAALQRRLTFFKTVLAVLAAYVLSVLAIYLILQHMAGGAVFRKAAQAAIQGLDQWTHRDALLYNLWKGGILSHGQPDGTQVFIEKGRGWWTFTPEVLQEFYKQIDYRLEGLLQTQFQGMLTSFGIYLAALGSYWALRIAQGAKPDGCPALKGMPPFREWYIPRALGSRLWVLAAGYLLMFLNAPPVVQLAGSLMFNVFYAVYVLQGMAVIDHRLSLGALNPWLKRMLLLLLFVLLQPLLLLMGIIDQLRDTRGFRNKNRETGEQ